MYQDTEFTYVIEGRVRGFPFKASGHFTPNRRAFQYRLDMGKKTQVAGIAHDRTDVYAILNQVVEDWFARL